MMPDELAFEFRQLDVGVVQLGCDFRTPVVAEQTEFLAHIDRFHVAPPPFEDMRSLAARASGEIRSVSLQRCIQYFVRATRSTAERGANGPQRKSGVDHRWCANRASRRRCAGKTWMLAGVDLPGLARRRRPDRGGGKSGGRQGCGFSGGRNRRESDSRGGWRNGEVAGTSGYSDQHGSDLREDAEPGRRALVIYPGYECEERVHVFASRGADHEKKRRRANRKLFRLAACDRTAALQGLRSLLCIQGFGRRADGSAGVATRARDTGQRDRAGANSRAT